MNNYSLCYDQYNMYKKGKKGKKVRGQCEWKWTTAIKNY